MAKTGKAENIGWYSMYDHNEYNFEYVGTLIRRSMLAGLKDNPEVAQILGDIMEEVFIRSIKNDELGVIDLADGTILRKMNQGRDQPATPWVDTGEFLRGITSDVTSSGNKFSVKLALEEGGRHDPSGMSYGKLAYILENGWTIHVTDPDSIGAMIQWLKNNLPGVYAPESGPNTGDMFEQQGDDLAVAAPDEVTGGEGAGIVIDIPPRPLMNSQRKRAYAQLFTNIFMEAWYAKVDVVRNALRYNPAKRWSQTAGKAARAQKKELSTYQT